MMKPTDEQLRDPKWWDENAPEGAQKYSPSTQYFYKEDDGYWFIAKPGEPWVDLFLANHLAKECVSRPAKPAAPEWDGEGLPPVGFTDNDCELVGVEGFAEGFEVVAHKGVAAIVWGPYQDDPEGQVETLLACHFRPLRSKEQRERDELIQLAHEVTLNTSPEDGPIEATIDAILSRYNLEPKK